METQQASLGRLMFVATRTLRRRSEMDISKLTGRTPLFERIPDGFKMGLELTHA